MTSMLCSGKNVQYHRLDGMTPELFEEKLHQWVAAHEGEHLARWQQISVIFCHVAEAIPAITSIIRFGHDQKSTAVIGLPADWRPYEHLLFVEYDDNLCWLRIYGDLSLRECQRLQSEFGYITLTELRASLRPDYIPAVEEILGPMADMKPYYEAKGGVECTVEQLILATDTICAQVLGLEGAAASEEARLNADLQALLRNDTDNDIGFLGALLIAACHSRFREAFLKREIMLLRYRLEVCYTSERQRAWFVSQWFPGLFTIQINNLARYLGHPDAMYFCPELRNPVTLKSRLPLQERVDLYCQEHFPNAPQASLYFHGDLQYLPEAIERNTPSIRGQVTLTHHELADYLCNYLEWTLDQCIAEIQVGCSVALAQPLWSRIERRADCFRKSDITAFTKGMKNPESQVVLRALLERTEFSFAFTERRHDAEFLEDFVLPFIRELDGDLGEWTGEPMLVKQSTGQQQQQQNNFQVRDSHILPESYSELQQYAKQHWPPCMRRIVKSCRAEHHLRYADRLRMAALFRMAGYSEAQGTELWRKLFSETNVYKNTTLDFLETEQGMVIGYDYQQNKQENLGISCKTMIGEKQCPISERQNTVDIEDCQSGCLGNFNKHHQSTLKFPIRSPQNYCQLSLKRVV